MQEPHQRIQSGKLRKAPRRSNSESSIRSPYEVITVYVGVESAGKLEIEDSDDSLESYLQTPSTLTNFHLEILYKIAAGCGLPNTVVDPDWRRTWNIGSWCIGSSLSVSMNIMQPNICTVMATITCQQSDTIESVINSYKAENLPRSTSHSNKIGKGYQLMGRWTLSILEKLIHMGTITRDSIEFGSTNIAQTRIFCWLLVDKESEYLCTLTKESVELLMGYIPNWCADMKEQSSASDITLRIKNPKVVGDSTQLVITTSGWLRYQGRLDNLSKLPEALCVALRSVMKSRQLVTFLESMEYKELPPKF